MIIFTTNKHLNEAIEPSIQACERYEDDVGKQVDTYFSTKLFCKQFNLHDFYKLYLPSILDYTLANLSKEESYFERLTFAIKNAVGRQVCLTATNLLMKSDNLSISSIAALCANWKQYDYIIV